MCWNEPVSWITFILGSLFNFLVAWYFQEIIITVICILWEWVILMQFFEAIAWRTQPNNMSQGNQPNNIPQGNQPTTIPQGNRFAGIGAMIANITQPIILGLGLICFTEVSVINKVVAMMVVFAYICWMIYALNESPHVNYLIPEHACHHLDYTWWNSFPLTSVPYMLALISLIFLLLRPIDLAWFEVLYIMVTVMISLLFYSCSNSMGSIWCWFAVAAPLATGIYWYFRTPQ